MNDAAETGIFVALGANLPTHAGAPRPTFEAALAALEAAGVHTLARSRLWTSPAWPPSDQPDFVNAVVAVETDKTPVALVETLHAVEALFGRSRRLRWEARGLDLDLIDYRGRMIPADWPGDAGSVSPGEAAGILPLAIPHPRLHERGFVLLPLADVAPGWTHPVWGTRIGDMIGQLPPAGRPAPLDADGDWR